MVMDGNISLIEELQKRVRELEDKVEALRISRRVLMNLIETVENERREQLSNLENKNDRLRKSNCRYAKIIMYRNLRINELEKKLKNFSRST